MPSLVRGAELALRGLEMNRKWKTAKTGPWLTKEPERGREKLNSEKTQWGVLAKKSARGRRLVILIAPGRSGRHQ